MHYALSSEHGPDKSISSALSRTAGVNTLRRSSTSVTTLSSWPPSRLGDTEPRSVSYPDMRGIWTVPTRGVPLSYGLLVWDWLVAAVVTLATVFSLAIQGGSWKIKRWLHAGMILLSG